jgi:REP element-mobilizing transposase RayT
MVLGYHAIFCAYGFWLPNDPRGSWSEFVRAWELLRFGDATKTNTRRSVAGRPYDRNWRKGAQAALKYPPVSFTGVQARAIGDGFANFVERSSLIIWACSILPEHVHLVVARHNYQIEQIVNLMKGDATRALREQQLHPLGAWIDANGKLPHCWARGEWKVFLDDEAAILRAIRYVEENPIKEGKPRQSWRFVRPHIPRSPSAPR